MKGVYGPPWRDEKRTVPRLTGKGIVPEPSGRRYCTQPSQPRTGPRFRTGPAAIGRHRPSGFAALGGLPAVGRHKRSIKVLACLAR